MWPAEVAAHVGGRADLDAGESPKGPAGVRPQSPYVPAPVLTWRRLAATSSSTRSAIVWRCGGVRAALPRRRPPHRMPGRRR